MPHGKIIFLSGFFFYLLPTEKSEGKHFFIKTIFWEFSVLSLLVLCNLRKANFDLFYTKWNIFFTFSQKCQILTTVRILTKIMENAHLVRKKSEFWTQVRNFEKLVKKAGRNTNFFKKLNFDKKKDLFSGVFYQNFPKNFASLQRI